MPHGELPHSDAREAIQNVVTYKIKAYKQIGVTNIANASNWVIYQHIIIEINLHYYPIITRQTATNNHKRLSFELERIWIGSVIGVACYGFISLESLCKLRHKKKAATKIHRAMCIYFERLSLVLWKCFAEPPGEHCCEN